MAQIALAWVLHSDFVCAPLVGTSRIEKLDELVETLEVKLSEKEIKYLEEPYKP